MAVVGDTSTHKETTSYLSHMRGLVKRSIIYAFGSLASPLVSLVLAPFLTRHLTRTEYGAFAVLTVTITLISGITQFGLAASFSRAYNCDYESPRDRLHVITTSIILLSCVSIPTVLVIMLLAPWLAVLLLGSTSFTRSITYVALVVLLQNFTIPGFSWLRAEKRATLSSALSIANLLTVLGMTIVLVGLLHMGIDGSLLATGVGYGVVVVCTLPVMLVRAALGDGLRWRTDIAKDLFFVGGPIVFSFLSFWVLQLSDRYLLSYFGSLAQTASYTVAYSLGGVLTPALLTPFIAAWHPIMYQVAKQNDASYIFRRVFRWYSLVSLLATFTLSLLSIIILNVLFPAAYHAVAPIIPVIAVSAMFYGISYVISIGVYIRKKTSYIPLLTTLAALANVGFNVFLIPRYGSMGAAVSTLLAFILLAFVSYAVNQHLYPIPFEFGLFTLALLLGVAFYLGSLFLAQFQKTPVAWVIILCALILYSGCLLILSGLLKGKHKNILQHIQEVSAP